MFDLDLWFDEVAILFQTEMSFAEIWSFSTTENFPPFYTWMLKVWGYFSTDIGWLRFLSAIFGSLIPLVCYLIGRELFNRKESLYFGLLCAFSVPLIYYSQNIRMYSLFVLLCSLSFLGFIKALKTNAWKYWVLVAVSNLLGFYTFLFMVFVMAGEFLVLFFRDRFRFTRYSRFLYLHLLVFILMLFWMVPFFERYINLSREVQAHITLGQIAKVFFFLGTGTDFSDKYLLAFFLNIPFALGFIMGIRSWKDNKQITALAILFCCTVLFSCVLSTLGPTILYGRYLLFLLPIYFALILHGYKSVKSKILRTVVLSAVFISLLYSNLYYYTHYLKVHDDFRYLWYEVERVDGHSFSKIAREVENQITEQEIIVHYSDPSIRSFSFFPFLYYHGREQPEYIYSKDDLPQHAGYQYLRTGERLGSLDELAELPKGIWVITLNSSTILTDYETLVETTRQSWIHHDNLPGELDYFGYKYNQSSSIGGVTAAHFILSDEEKHQVDK
ncbi:hypothetical protein CEE37_01085 [candidate division LCP-89 bacterium B3_LCP]|uniref:Glycosyltransferase RgtA/B/C/D-like domain-containing protein n=1 Tax=candidate division LCP-89 bacterium B3_LCP TaxID=2012998 RepID=A0A532V521_UNCL8|nr:MAG: hypothetical protein CEE37_01085 [candidate division LCP-89 bacterium B3_LCP]